MRIRLSGAILLSIVGLSIVGVGRVSADQWCGGCQVDPYERTDPETGEIYWIDGCNGCTATSCGPGEYEAPNGGCYEVGTGNPVNSCFPAGTGIAMEDGTRKNIEEVEIGDRVVSQDEAGNRSSSVVTDLIQPVSDNMCRIDFEGGDSLEVTNSHPLMTDGGWKAIDVTAAEREEESVQVTQLAVRERL